MKAKLIKPANSDLLTRAQALLGNDAALVIEVQTSPSAPATELKLLVVRVTEKSVGSVVIGRLATDQDNVVTITANNNVDVEYDVEYAG